MTVAAENKPLTKDDLINMEPADLQKLISTPEGATLVETIWNAQPEAAGGSQEPVLTPEEEAAAAAEVVAAAEAQRLADEAKAAEDVRKAAEEAARKTPTKFVFDKEIKNDKGEVIRRVHLEAASQEELNQKIADSYSLLTSAYEKLKGQKLTVKPAEAPAATLSDEELTDLIKEIRKGEDPKAAVQALKKITGTDKLDEQRKQLEIETAKNAAQAVSNEFMRRHITDFNPCEANGKKIGEYIQGKNPSGEILEWNIDNLELAFLAVESELAPLATVNPVAVVPQTPNAIPAPPVTANPAPVVAPAASVAPVLEAPAATVEAVPVPVSTVPAPVAANPAPVRRVPSSGVVPGSTQGRAGTPVPVGLTKADIVKMTPQEMKRRMRDPKLRAELERVANLKS